MVGGFGSGDGNRINGGGSAIRGGGPNLVVAGNRIGLNADGSEVLMPPSEGIRIFSAELQDPNEEAFVVGNEIGLNGGRGIAQDGLERFSPATKSSGRVSGSSSRSRTKDTGA